MSPVPAHRRSGCGRRCPLPGSPCRQTSSAVGQVGPEGPAGPARSGRRARLAASGQGTPGPCRTICCGSRCAAGHPRPTAPAAVGERRLDPDPTRPAAAAPVPAAPLGGTCPGGRAPARRMRWRLRPVTAPAPAGSPGCGGCGAFGRVAGLEGAPVGGAAVGARSRRRRYPSRGVGTAVVGGGTAVDGRGRDHAGSWVRRARRHLTIGRARHPDRHPPR